MALVKRANNDYGIRSLHNQIDEMFDNFFRSSFLPTSSTTSPSLDIYSEDDKSMVVEMQAPGFDEKDIDIRLQNGVLEIKASHSDKQQEGSKKRGYLVKESSSSFYRRLVLPEYVDEEKVNAHLEKGVLKLTIPFAERPEPKRIQVKSTSGNSKKLAEKNK
jgi:HSP20 family protein